MVRKKEFEFQRWFMSITLFDPKKRCCGDWRSTTHNCSQSGIWNFTLLPKYIVNISVSVGVYMFTVICHFNSSFTTVCALYAKYYTKMCCIPPHSSIIVFIFSKNLDNVLIRDENLKKQIHSLLVVQSLRWHINWTLWWAAIRCTDNRI